jgi:integrase/recombinase XerD
MKSFMHSEFLDYIRKVRKNSSLTVDSYSRDLSLFFNFLEGRGINSANDVGENDIALYLIKLKQGGKSPATVSRNVATLRNYFSFLFNMKAIESNPSFNISPPKVERKCPDILTEKEVELLLSKPDPATLLGMRDKAMLELLYASGLKVSELLSLDREDVDLDMGFIMNKSRGKDRIMKIDRKSTKVISDYLDNVKEKSSAEDSPLFLNSNGTRLTRQGLWKIIKKYSSECSIGIEVTPHTIRHSFAVHSLRKGHDINELKEKLGHLHISSTSFYSDLLKTKDL